jgi:hypothetical protein
VDEATVPTIPKNPNDTIDPHGETRNGRLAVHQSRVLTRGDDRRERGNGMMAGKIREKIPRQRQSTRSQTSTFIDRMSQRKRAKAKKNDDRYHSFAVVPVRSLIFSILDIRVICKIKW